MQISKDFDRMLAENAGVRPTFRIGGQDFTLRAKLPYTLWNRLLAAMRDDDVETMESTVAFFNTVLIRDDRQRFRELLDREEDDDGDEDEDVIDLNQMNALTEWVMEHFTGKLRSSTDGSTPGAKETGGAPNVVSLQSKKAAN